VTGLCVSVNVKMRQSFWWIFDNNLKPPFEFKRDYAVPASRGLTRGSAVPCLLQMRVRIPQGARLSRECCLLQGTGL
jgi:hypothetical protein